MNTSLKHTLNPSFALLFAVGVERLYKILDPVVLQAEKTVSVLVPNFYMPFTMVLLTLLFGTLSAIANDRFLEAKPHASATSRTAFLSYASIGCTLWMFYFSVDLAFVGYWWIGYAALCTVNAVWNWLAIKSPYHRPHVALNIAVVVVLFVIILAWPSALTSPLLFYLLLILIGAGKWWQRGHERFSHLKTS